MQGFEQDAPQNQSTKAALLAIAAAGLGWAIQVRDGLYDPVAFIGLTITLFAALAFFLPVRLPVLKPDVTRGIFAAAIIFNFIQWLAPHRLPGSWHGTHATPFFYICITAAFAISIAIILCPSANRLLLFALLILFCLVGGWMLIRVPQPYMDAWILQTEGLKSFLHGHNPFSTPFVDIYHRPELYVPSALHTDGLIHQGFPYPPMVLWLELPGQLLAGDYRWSNLAAMALTAWLIGNTSPGRLGPMAAALFLFTPRALFVLESGWTEPTTALLLAVTVFCAVRIPRLMPICLGLFLCSKQYLLWAVPPVLLLLGHPPQRGRLLKILLIAFLTGCAVSLPLILWDVKAFLAANVDVAQGAAFRTDALSYLALWANKTHIIPSPRIATIIGFTTALAATLLVCRRGPRSPAGYAAAVATAHLVFFAFYKFAFCNYDWFLIAAFCSAAGALGFEKQSALKHAGMSAIEAAESVPSTDRTEPA